MRCECREVHKGPRYMRGGNHKGTQLLVLLCQELLTLPAEAFCSTTSWLKAGWRLAGDTGAVPQHSAVHGCHQGDAGCQAGRVQAPTQAVIPGKCVWFMMCFCRACGWAVRPAFAHVGEQGCRGGGLHAAAGACMHGAVHMPSTINSLCNLAAYGPSNCVTGVSKGVAC